MRKKLSFLSVLALSGALCSSVVASKDGTCEDDSFVTINKGYTVRVYVSPPPVHNFEDPQYFFRRFSELNQQTPFIEIDVTKKMTTSQETGSMDEFFGVSKISDKDEAHKLRMLIMQALFDKIDNINIGTAQCVALANLENIFQWVKEQCDKALEDANTKLIQVSDGPKIFSRREYCTKQDQNTDQVREQAKNGLKKLKQKYESNRLMLRALKVEIAGEKVRPVEERLIKGMNNPELVEGIHKRSMKLQQELSYLPCAILKELNITLKICNTGKFLNAHPLLDPNHPDNFAHHFGKSSQWLIGN